MKKVESYLAKDARAVLAGGGQVKTALNVVSGVARVERPYAGLSKKVERATVPSVVPPDSPPDASAGDLDPADLP